MSRTTKKNARTLCAVAGLVAGGAAMGYLAGFGPLDPPAGPVAETSPSLAEISQQIAELGSASGAEDFSTGPWEVFRAPMTGSAQDQFDATLVALGRVYVESIEAHRGYFTVFDGPGRINGAGTSETPNWIARNASLPTGSGNNISYFTTVTIPIQQIVENGLYVAWDAQLSTSFVVVRYRVLEDQP